jgi:NADPH2 dehydrogenase
MAALFSPLKVGTSQLKHRVVLAPMTRFRASAEHVPVVRLMKDHYAQRGAVPGTLLVTEGVFIAPEAGGMGCVPGIWNSDQIKAWKEVSSNLVHW